MTPSRVHQGSLRLDRREITRLGRALAISLVIHLLCFGTYEAGHRLHLWDEIRLPSWLRKIQLLAAGAQSDAKPLPQQEPPLVFVDVNPESAAPQAPKNAKYYSNRNSQAANPDADRETDIPKIEGKQTEVAKVEDTPRTPFDKLMPDFSKLDKAAEEAKPASPQAAGDLVMAKPDPHLRPETGAGAADESRPRTITEALRRQHRNQLIGEKMKQEGGVNRVRLDPGLDVKATPFGAYDAAFIGAVQSRWYDLLDNLSYDGYRRGKVVLEFRLNYNGYVTDMKVLEENVGSALSLMCQKAVADPAPYDKWPREMRLMVGKDYRDITFTFYYN
jgi:hypothetical protein